MDQNIQKALWLGVSIMMFVAIVSTGLFLFNKGKTVADAGGEQLDNVSEQLSMVEYTAFDNEVIKGDLLANTIKQRKSTEGEFIIVVTTSYPSTIQYISTGTVASGSLTGSLTAKTRAQQDSDLQNLKNETSASYINPHGKFMAQLIYDSNDVVRGIIAIQQ
jgi:hypothetical protein